MSFGSRSLHAPLNWAILLLCSSSCFQVVSFWVHWVSSQEERQNIKKVCQSCWLSCWSASQFHIVLRKVIHVMSVWLDHHANELLPRRQLVNHVDQRRSQVQRPGTELAQRQDQDHVGQHSFTDRARRTGQRHLYNGTRLPEHVERLLDRTAWPDQGE